MSEKNQTFEKVSEDFKKVLCDYRVKFLEAKLEDDYDLGYVFQIVDLIDSSNNVLDHILLQRQ
jgi:hypothetical protein